MNLTEKQMNFLTDACDALDYSLHSTYSGRGLYGRKCFGFSTNDRGGELKFANALLESAWGLEEDMEEVRELLNSMAESANSDSLGLGTIYYYLDLKWVDAPKKVGDCTDYSK